MGNETPLEYALDTKVHVYLDIWTDGWCNAWVLKDEATHLLIECDDSPYTVLRVRKDQIHLGWRS